MSSDRDEGLIAEFHTSEGEVFVVQGEGGGKGGKTPVEAADSLFSNSIGSVVDLISEGEIEGLVGGYEGIYYNETPYLSGGTQNYTGATVALNYGTEEQAALPGFNDVTTSVPVSQPLPFNTPYTVSFPNDGLYTAVEITLSTSNFFKVEDDGDTVGTYVSFTIETSENGGAFQTAVNGSIRGKQKDEYNISYRLAVSDTSGNTSVRVTRTKADSTSLKDNDEIQFKLYTKVTEHMLAYPNCAIAGHQFDAKQFGNKIPTRQYHVKGIKVMVPSNYDPVERTYNGAWNGSLTGPVYTNNPAWIFYDLATNQRYGLGQFIDASYISLPSLYTIGKWCDELVFAGTGERAVTSAVVNTGVTTVTTTLPHGWSTGTQVRLFADGTEVGTGAITVTGATTYTFVNGSVPGGTYTAKEMEPRWACNTVINQRGEAFNLLRDMVSCFRGVLFWMDSKLWAMADMPQDGVKIVTNANVINGEFTYSGESNRSRFSVVKVSWNDPAIMYRRGVEVYEDPDLIRELGWKPTDFGSFGCTSRGQARRLAKAILFEQEYGSEIVTYRASFDHLAVDGDGPAGIAPGDIIYISDHARGNAVQGGRVSSVAGSVVTVAVQDGSALGNTGPFNGTFYVEHADGTVEWLACTYGSGTITVTETPATPIAENDLYILVDSGFEAEPFRVVKVSETEPHIYEIAAVRWDDAKFNAVYAEEDYDFSEIMTLPTVGTVLPPTGPINFTEAFISNPDYRSRTLELSWTASTDPLLLYYQVFYSKDDDNWTDVPATSVPGFKMENIRAGDYNFRVVAVNRAGVTSTALEGTYVVDAVPDPSVLAEGAITNLQLEQGGSSFGGRDAKFKWTVTTPTGDYLDAKLVTGTDVGLADPAFRDCLVRVRKTDGTLLREESVIDTHYIYSLEKNAEDNAGLPLRNIRVDVHYRDIYGRTSAANTVTVNNPAPTLPSPPVLTPALGGFAVDIVAPSDLDWAGMKVYADLTSNGVTVSAPDLRYTGPNTQVILQKLDDASHDVIVVPYDAFGDGTPSATGSVTPLVGETSVTGYLTNESHTVATASDGTGGDYSGAGGTFKTLLGTNDVTTSATYAKTSGGAWASINPTTGVYTISDPGTDTATATFTSTYSGYPAITKTYAIAKSKGGTGGTAGADAKLVTLTTTHHTFPYDALGAPKTQTATYTATKQNTAQPVSWNIRKADGTLIYGDNKAAIVATGYFGDGGGDSLTQTQTQFNNLITSATTTGLIIEAVVADGASYTDKVSVTKVQDGADGTNGTNGTDALVGYLTNESHVVPANSSGTVTSYAGATGYFKVFLGTTDVTAGCTFAVLSNPQVLSGPHTSGTAMDNATGQYTVDSGFDAGETSASITFRATHTASGQTIDKVFSLSKSQAGTDGTNGTNGTNAVGVSLSATRQYFSYDANGDAKGGTITFTAQRQNGSGAAAGWNVYDSTGAQLLAGSAAAIAASGYFTEVNGDTLTMSLAQYQSFTNYGGVAARETFVVEVVYDTIRDKVTVATLRDGVMGSNFEDGMNYGSAQAFSTAWSAAGSGEVTLVASDNRGGYSVQIGNNVGNDGLNILGPRWVDYNPEDLYEVWFDVEVVAATANYYFGVQAVDRAGNNLGGTYNYVVKSAGTLALGRQTLRGYLRGHGGGFSGASVANDPANPAPLPDGSAPHAFGQGPSVKIRPVALLHYTSDAGQIVLHGAGVRKIDDATVTYRGDWSNSTTYYRNDGVLFMGRTFAAKSKHSGQAPPQTSTSNTYWYLVSDRPSGTYSLTVNDPTKITWSGSSVRTPATAGGWGTVGAYSPQMYGAGAVISFKAPRAHGTERFMVGLNDDPAADANFTGINYALFFTQLNDVYVYENSVNVLTGQTWDTSATYFIKYDGEYVRYSYVTTAGVETLLREVYAGPNKQFALDISVDTVGSMDELLFYGGSGKPANAAAFTPVLSSNMARKGNGFIKVSGASLWDGQVYSKEKISNAKISFRAVDTVNHAMLGLNSDPTTDASYTSIDHATYFAGSGNILIYESGGLGVQVATYTTGDILSVEQREDVIYHCKNGVPIWVSQTLAPNPMAFDSSYLEVGMETQDVVFGTSPALPDFIEPKYQRLTYSGSTWTKDATTGWGDAGFISKRGYVGAQLNFTVPSAATNLMVGFTTSRKMTKSFGDMEYALYFATGTFHDYRLGVNTTTLGSYAAGDNFTLKHTGTSLEILKNGVLIYTITGISASQVFYAMSDFYTASSSISNFNFTGTGSNGQFRDIRFKRSLAQPTTPTGAEPSGWSNAVPGGSDTLWSSTALKSFNGTLMSLWSTPQSLSGLVHRGSYSSSATYYLNNTVTYSGGTYVAVADNFSAQAPSGNANATTYWDVLAAPGEAGTPASPPSGYTATINLSTTNGTVNLRTIADNHSTPYPGGDATITFVVPNGVTIRGLSGNGNKGIDTGIWPTGYTISLTLQVDSGGIVDGGGGHGGDGGSYGNGQNGGAGGDAVYCRRNITITNAGTIRGGGGGGGGGDSAYEGWPEPTDYGGGGGGGGFPNGAAGLGGASDNSGDSGTAGTTSGGGTYGSGGGLYGQAGASGGGAATAGGNAVSGNGGAAGYAIRQNGNTISYSGAGTLTGTNG